MRAGRATARLLWAACRPAPRASDVAGAVVDGADVPRAARAAIPQHLGPLLWRALNGAGLLDRLGQARNRLNNEFEAQRNRATRLLPVGLAAAVDPLAQAGIEPVVLMGPAVAMRYPQSGLRPVDHIALLVPPDQHEDAFAALTSTGWRISDATARRSATVLEHADAPHLPLELYSGLDSWRARAYRLDAPDLWTRRTPIDCMGVAAFGPRVEDELVMLAVEAAKPSHHFQRLIWSVDIAVVVEAARGELDWELLAARARDARCATALAVGLHHARRLGADVPEEVVAMPRSRWRLAGLAPVLDEAWPLLSGDERTGHRLRYALPDARRDRVLLAIGEVRARGLLYAPARAIHLSTEAVRRTRAVRRTAKFAHPG